LGLRFLAGALDLLVLNFVFMSILLLMGKSPMDFLNLASKASPKLLAVVLTTLAGSLLYYPLLEGLWGAAVGKAICRLRVVGPDRNVPGFGRAFVRALIYVVAPALPYWMIYSPKAYFDSSTAMQYLMMFSFYIVLALLFCTARRRNGFAAVQDLVTKTRVISRVALESRVMLVTAEMPPPAVEAGPTVGPYHVLETLGQSAGTKWLLGYDLCLFRKVWIHVVPPGTPPVPAALRNIGRVGRLRWLTGRRSTEENWDAFEAAGGKPLVHLAQTRQPWSQVRFWLYDLAREISAAARDGTLPPVLVLDRVWITGDGRAKLLDFPAPGLASTTAGTEATVQPSGRFLSEVAAAALAGRAKAIAGAADAVTVPLPLHARNFLDRLPQLPDPDVVAGSLKPLLQRVTLVSRWRRAAIVAGCLVVPLFACFSMIYGMSFLKKSNRSNPGVMELNMLLGQRTGMNSRWAKNQPHPTDRQFAIYIASHYRSVVTNDAVWTGAFTMSMIKGEARRFAEQSIVEHPAPTEEEIKEADAVLKEPLASLQMFDLTKNPWFSLLMAGGMLMVYVCIPALITALLFRGGLVLFIARVTFVRKDGARASRLRVFWRALVAWSPLLLGLILDMLLAMWLGPFAATLVVSLLICGLTILSVALPDRGLPDRLAGTWPVPR
jgi:hypothetical protein